jgi:hypothetical protein
MTLASCTYCLPDETAPPRAPLHVVPSPTVLTSVSWLEPDHPTYMVEWKRADEVKEFSRVSTVIEKNLIEYEGRTFRLRGQPLFVVLEQNDDCWTYATQDLDIEGCADTPAEALDQLACRLAYLWDEYACEDDARLGRLAQQVKRNIRRRVSVDADARRA